ncbi:hypothetical protein ACMD2_15993 [Ananas comosus]|uniref:Protein MNN4-like n=1 Tax=Ananas comosus TaxID=4615 RepID=A0A199VVA1_ANACO|nr:hypothetical protein ACMD2_15993 [Ananas comosus]
MVLRPRLRPTPLSDRLRTLILPLPRRFAGDKAVAESGSGGGVAASSDGAAAAVEARKEAYRQIQNLDFMTAAKILFTTPPKRKKFGLDFHLVQLFFACMPSLAVYLVAQYARYEIRRMEAEVEEKKKKAEEEEKAKQAELESLEEDKDLKLSKVIDRLDKLEEVVKEIADEKKKTPTSDSSKDQEVKSKEEASSAEKSSDQKNYVEAKELTTNKSKESPEGQARNVDKAKAASN